MILVTYKIQDGDQDYFEYSWFSKLGTKSDYDKGVIKDNVLIEEVYGDLKKEEGWVNWGILRRVHSVQDLMSEELGVLDKFGVVNK
jgi:hypothetical protein